MGSRIIHRQVANSGLNNVHKPTSPRGEDVRLYEISLLQNTVNTHLAFECNVH